jgi:UDP-glucose 4-epimerase
MFRLPGMKSLVTGGAGFIGSHLVDALVARGDEILVLDDLSTGKEANLTGALTAGAALERADITDGQAMTGLLESFGPEAVFHLAAQIDVRKSMADPGFDVRLNVLGTVNVLEAAARAGVQRLVFTSTGGAIYGEGAARTDELPFAETARCEPFSIYGQSKLAAEGYVELYRRTRGLSGTVVRLGNVYGPRQDPATEAGVVAIFCDLARDGGRPTVFGDGKQTRDYIHVADVVSALLAAGESDSPGPFNVGTGVETTVLRLVELIGGLSGRSDFEPEFAPPREGEVERTALDTSSASRELGWSAERPIESGLEQTLSSSASSS